MQDPCIFNHYEEHLMKSGFDFESCSLTSTIEPDERNAESRSDVLCPRNSSMSENEQLFLETGFKLDNNALKFKPRLQVINKKYQEENNGNMDIGIDNEAGKVIGQPEFSELDRKRRRM